MLENPANQSMEWLFTEIMYKTEDINANIDKLDAIKYNYTAAGAL